MRLDIYLDMRLDGTVPIRFCDCNILIDQILDGWNVRNQQDVLEMLFQKRKQNLNVLKMVLIHHGNVLVQYKKG